MNPFSAIWSVFASVFSEAGREQRERAQEGPQGQLYGKWLDKYGYEAQYQAYQREHGTNEGFVYKDPGDMPEGWRG